MNKLAGIDAAIGRYYGRQAVAKELTEAILYSVNAGGKRIRPLILLELLQGFGLELTEAHFDVAAAVEMIHTGSLIHDDLPAMDDDDYRRGRLTNHKKFGEATAILAGDSLFLDPFNLIAKTDLPKTTRLELIALLSECSGSFGMVGGQMMDMLGEKKQTTLAELEQIHTNKTGKLLIFPFVSAGLIADVKLDDIEKLRRAGELVGLAFQVRDDILDVTATFEEIGKTPQKDLAADKSTYPGLLGLEKSYDMLETSLHQAQDIFKTLEKEQGFNPAPIMKMLERLRLDA